MVEVRKTEVFEAWLLALRDERARTRINARIRRLALGNPGDVKPVGEGVANSASTMDPDIDSILCGAQNS